MRRAFLAACLLALAVAGCGGTESSPKERQSSKSTGSPLWLTKAEAKETAKGMLLRSSDLPGWTETRPKKADTKGVCGGAFDGKKPDRSVLANAESPLFVNHADRAVVGSGATVLRKERQARRAFALLVRRSNEGRSCFSQAFRAGWASGGGSSGRPQMRPLGYRVAERSWGFRAIFPIRAKGISGRGYLSFVFMQQRQAVSVVVFFRAFRPFPRGTEVRLARLVAKRMRAAQDARQAAV